MRFCQTGPSDQQLHGSTSRWCQPEVGDQRSAIWHFLSDFCLTSGDIVGGGALAVSSMRSPAMADTLPEPATLEDQAQRFGFGSSVAPERRHGDRRIRPFCAARLMKMLAL
jgi:hypothetical protein